MPPLLHKVSHQHGMILVRSNYGFIHFTGGDCLKHVLFIGDQLTVERARGCQEARVNSDTMQEALLGLEPATADWHAEANYLEVR